MARTARLTEAQKGFLLSISDAFGDGYFSCYRRDEARTAWALQSRGLVEFSDEGEPEQGRDYFESRLTLEGIEAVEKTSPGHLT